MRWLVILGILSVLVGCDNPPKSQTWAIPQVSIHKSHLPDLSDAGTTERKQRFTEYLLPMVRLVNTQVLKEREMLLHAQQLYVEEGKIPRQAKVFIKKISKTYKVPYDGKLSNELFETLIKRVDVIPPDLVLAQAANESAWGTSRFAQDGNNLFGQWCFRRGCGLVPEQRPDGATHEVQKFRSPYNSLEAYIRNLNTHPAYDDLRTIREDLREDGKPISGLELVEGLVNYSEMGRSYVDALAALMRSNSDLWPDTVDIDI